MIELHGWITIKETYKAIYEGNDDIIDKIKEEIEKRHGVSVMNVNCLELSGLSKETKE